MLTVLATFVLAVLISFAVVIPVVSVAIQLPTPSRSRRRIRRIQRVRQHEFIVTEF